MDDKFIQNISGKQFVRFEGLLDKFHELKGKSIETEMIQSSGLIIFKATVKGSIGTFTGHGDASKENVNRMISPHIVRMAETRAVARALRLYTNVGMCSVDELGGDDVQKKRTAEIISPSIKTDVPKEEQIIDDEDMKTEVPMICAVCRLPLTEKVKDFSIRHYGKTLCLNCQKKEEKERFK